MHDLTAHIKDVVVLGTLVILYYPDKGSACSRLLLFLLAGSFVVFVGAFCLQSLSLLITDNPAKMAHTKRDFLWTVFIVYCS